MSNNNRKGKQQAASGQKKSSAAASEKTRYEDAFPPLSGSSTIPTATNTASSVPNQPTTSIENEEPQQKQSNKKFGPWKPLPMAPQTMSLLSFMPSSTTEKAAATNTGQSTNRAPARNFVVQSEIRCMSNQEESIDTKICEIIWTIHLRHEYVSLEQVQRDLFAHYGVQSFRDLNVDPRNLNSLKKHSDRIKDVIFYMQIFKQIYNLSTMHDLEPLLAKFLKVNKYEDVHLGPLDENPEVKRVFDYKPSKRRQPIPQITAGQIITHFLDFQERNQTRHYKYEDFLEEILEENQLKKREELGIFCRSFPYLTEVTKKVAQEYKKHEKRVESEAKRHIITAVEAKLWEIREEVRSEFEGLSSYTDKTPIAVFDHLVKVVEKHLTVSEQKSVRDLLVKIRNDELLRCLLNISIFLGTLDQPEQFVAQLKKLNQTDTPAKQNAASTGQSRGNQNRMQQSNSTLQENVNFTRTTVETSYENSASFSNRSSVSLKQLCTDLFKILSRFDSILTIKQLFDIKKILCQQYSKTNFSELGFTDDDGDQLDFISFIYKYREKIDPSGELSIYETILPTGDRLEVYSFVNQLTVLNTWREKQQQQDEQSNTREIPLSKDQLSAVEKAVQHKFGGTLTNNRALQLIKKAKNHHSKKTHSIIHFEESLMDEINLKRLSISPSSLLVDESQLCQIILQCPIMSDLSTWLQWSHFFQSKYGALKTFINRKAQELDRLLLLETSNHQLWRLPIDASPETFEKELNQGHIRSSVGHLCSLIICEYVQVNRLPFTIYGEVMNRWFIRLRSAEELQRDLTEPMQYVLEFLTYLPGLIGQSRIVQELVLNPLDQVFGNDEDDEHEEISPRQRIWMLADRQQRSKLEMWAHLLDIDEWKNDNKWQGIDEPQEESPTIRQPIIEIPKREKVENIPSAEPLKVPRSPIVTIPSSPAVVQTSVPITEEISADETHSHCAAFEHIKQIREGFGVDRDPDAPDQSVVNNLQGMLGRSLQKLSNDLYSEQGHFVLELIQNADDNQYLSDRLPTLRFVVSSDRILVCNNELGFQPENIKAICDVGGSTKGKHKQGYAGHKGIGFKSVFMISHRPEIHSGEYHFCFDTVNGTEKIGYIRPIWLDNSGEVLPSSDQWTTCIRLPIREDKRGDRLKRNFEDIHARLLLFLNRLRQIEIIRQKGNNDTDSQIFTRIDHAQGRIIELQKKTSPENVHRTFWLVIKTVISVPESIKKQLSDVKGSVEETTIAIAYPLESIHNPSSHQVLSSQPIFAYLPLRSYGFHFILQGDFEIPANRQEILRDNVWNEWLKREMVKLLPSAYDLFKDLPNVISTCSTDVQEHLGSLTTMQTIKYFIKMIPTPNQIDPYFNSFIDRSIQSLMGFIHLPIIRNDQIEWISPTQCVIVRDPFIRQIFSQDLLLSHFNNYYLDEQFVNECDQSILIKLGCRRLDFSNILRLIRTLYTQNQQEHSTKTTTIEQIAQWFLCIDYSLQQERENPGFNIDDQNEVTTMDQLKQMKIIPLKDQSRLVSIEEFHHRAILFPLEKSASFEKHLKIVLEDLPTIDERLIEYIEKKYPRRLESIKCLFKDLGISESRNVRRIYSNHIFPILSDDQQWSSKSDSVLIAYLIFIYRELYAPNPEHFANEMEKLRSQIIIKTRQGKFLRINSDIVHLTSLYGCQISLELLKLSSNPFHFISDDYYNQYRTEFFHQDRERYRFKSFLNELNLTDSFLIKTIDKGFIYVEQLAETQWSDIIGTLSAVVFEPFIIQDNSSEEFDALITSKDNTNSDDYAQILLYLDYCFELVKLYYVASVIKARDRNMGSMSVVQGVESSFCLSLRKHPWIPVSGGELLKPTDVYILPLNHPFRRYVPCFDQGKIPLKNPDFIKLLGFKQEIPPIIIFELFIKWSCNLDKESLQSLMDDDQVSNVIPCTIPSNSRQSCRDTIQNIYQIYHFLASNEETRALISRFRLWPLVFIPRSSDTGDFLFAHEVFWQDSEALLTDKSQHIALQPFYGNDVFSKQFFSTILQVKQEPTLEDYLSLLNELPEKKKEFIWKFIQVITRLTFKENKQSIVKDKCVNLPFIPCLDERKKLVTYDDRPYYPHDMNIARLFADTIPIIDLPDHLIDFDQFKQQFCSLFNIEDLADVVKVLVDVDNAQPAMELLHFYSHTIELIQQFLLHNKFITESRSSHLQSIFADLEFISVDYIRLSYQYRDKQKVSSSSVLDSYIDESARKFYVLHKYEKSDSRHIDTMSNYLIENESTRLKLSQYIRSLCRSYQDQGEQGLIKLNVETSEQSVPKWTIPKLIKKELSYSSDEESEEEEDEVIDQPIVTKEMIEAIQNELGRQMKPSRNIIIDPDQPKPLLSVPQNAGADDRIPSNDNKQQTNKTQILPSNDLTISTSSSVSKTIDEKNPTNDKENIKQTTSIESDRVADGKKTEASTASSHRTPLTIDDFSATQSRINFQEIRISNFSDIALSPSTLPNPPTTTNLSLTSNETDAELGRRGEDFVYRYLLWKYPDAEIQWANQRQEFGDPFDIQIIHPGKKKQIDLVEVKTTRVLKQNTFQISVKEVECLLKNPKNYFIYRVYYANDEKSSTITIISQIKCHLEQKQLALSITIAEPIEKQ